jgi:nucleotide-binding universal stress UspA family protein
MVLVQVYPNGRGGAEYLERVAGGVQGEVQTKLLEGRPADALTRIATDLHVSDVVMTSHGRSGLSRVIAGDTAADLIERLSIPIIVVPPSARVHATGGPF